MQNFDSMLMEAGFFQRIADRAKSTFAKPKTATNLSDISDERDEEGNVISKDNSVQQYIDNYAKKHGPIAASDPSSNQSFDSAELNDFVSRRKADALKKHGELQKSRAAAERIVKKEKDAMMLKKAKKDTETFQKSIEPPTNKITADPEVAQDIAKRSENALGNNSINNIIPNVEPIQAPVRKIGGAKVQDFQNKVRAAKKAATTKAGNELGAKLQIGEPQNPTAKPLLPLPPSATAAPQINLPKPPMPASVTTAVAPKPFSAIKDKKSQSLDIIKQFQQANPTAVPVVTPSKKQVNLVPNIKPVAPTNKVAQSLPAFGAPQLPAIDKLNRDLGNIMGPKPAASGNPLDRLKDKFKKPMELGDADMLSDSTEFSLNLRLLENELNSFRRRKKHE